MAKVVNVLFISFLLTGCATSVRVQHPPKEHRACPEMKITGYGIGNNDAEATTNAWNDARGKLSIGGLADRFGLVEERKECVGYCGNIKGQERKFTITFRLVPVRPVLPPVPRPPVPPPPPAQPAEPPR